ncbi:hypothetical protein LTR06_011104 [Exophiala xenobiotica]|nr:hypothetical protein LTR06_011104 [Exophiala xenobiotica]
MLNEIARFWEPEANGIKDCLKKAPQARSDGSSSDTDIVSYLSDKRCLTAWTAVQDALFEFQGPGNGSNTVTWDSAISKASLFLELGEEALKSWSSARQTLQPSAAISDGVEAKLLRLLRFNDIYSRKTWQNNKDHHNPPNHRFFLSMAQLRESKEHTIKATNQTQNHNSSLLTVSWVMTIACAVLLVPAWRRSSQKAGSSTDADFWLLLQTTSMQLLSLFTTLAPLYGKKSEHSLPWPMIWTRVLGVLGFCCSAAAVPLYLFVPTFWSSALSFLGSAFQTGLVLQLAIFVDAAWSVRQKND